MFSTRPLLKCLYLANGSKNFAITHDYISKSCRAYFANIRHLDDKTCELMITTATIASINIDRIEHWTDEIDLLPFISIATSMMPVLMECAAEGSTSLLVGVRNGDFKFFCCPTDQTQLFNLASEPDEMQNLTGVRSSAYNTVHFNDLMNVQWNMEKFDVYFK